MKSMPVSSKGSCVKASQLFGWREAMAGLVATLCVSCTGTVMDGVSGEGSGAGDSTVGGVPSAGGAKPGGSVGTGPGGADKGTVPSSTTPPVDPVPDRVASPVCKGTEPGPTIIRRLNRVEYNNTVRDLLGDVTSPASSFAPEPAVHAFDNDAASLSASPVLIEDYLSAAERLSSTAVDKDLNGLLGCDPVKTGEDACAQQFFASFGKRAYRRPLAAEDTQILTGIYTKIKTLSGFKSAIRLSLATMLGSSHFLYRVEFGAAPAKAGDTVTKLTTWELATRLSYLLWRTTPDTALLTAAESNKLGTREEIDAQVTRMLADPKARATVADFHEQWLRLRNLDGLEKDATVYPTFKPQIADLMKAEALKFIDNVVWDGAGTMKDLYTSPFTFADATLSKYYGLPAPVGAGMQKIAVDSQPRSGLLTQGGLLSVLAQPNSTHPVRRGAFVRQNLMCQTLPPPPDGVVFKVPPPSKVLTGRERFLQHRVDPACSGCHSLTDPIGFGFENFDGVGIYRATENGKVVDASGEVVGLEGGGIFNGPAELGALLGKSTVAADCMVTAWFRYGYGRDLAGSTDACSVDILKRGFASRNFKVTDLLASLTKTDAFQFRRVVSPGGAQ